MIDIAYAMAPQQGGGSQVNFIMQLLPIIAIMAVFYFLLIRPQQKKQQQHTSFLKGLKKGDSVITQGGLLGSITSISDNVVTLEIADKVKVRVSRGHIAGPAGSSDTEAS
jgi:preprotein translocase subunit YajC